MNFITVCKNVIMSNNKKNWVNPEPAIRVAKTQTGKAVGRNHSVGIVDSNGNIVAIVATTKDGKPLMKCGAKVAIITKFDVIPLD